MVGLFVVAAAVTALAIPPSLVLGGPAAYAGGRPDRTLMRPASRGGADPDGSAATESAIAL